MKGIVVQHLQNLNTSNFYTNRLTFNFNVWKCSENYSAIEYEITTVSCFQKCMEFEKLQE